MYESVSYKTYPNKQSMVNSPLFLELYDFWKKNGIPPVLAANLNIAFWQCSISEVQAMTDEEITSRMHDPRVSPHKSWVMRLVHQARDRQSPWNIAVPSPSHNPTYEHSFQSHSGNPNESRSHEPHSPSRNPTKYGIDLSIHGQSTVNNYFV